MAAEAQGLLNADAIIESVLDPEGRAAQLQVGTHTALLAAVAVCVCVCEHGHWRRVHLLRALRAQAAATKLEGQFQDLSIEFIDRA